MEKRTTVGSLKHMRLCQEDPKEKRTTVHVGNLGHMRLCLKEKVGNLGHMRLCMEDPKEKEDHCRQPWT